MTVISKKALRTSAFFGGGYGDFLKFKGRYRVLKGSRASKKSKNTALNIIFRMKKYQDANTLVVRKVFRTLKDSCFADLKWAIHRIGDDDDWEIKESPLEITRKSTGQKILFRGLDDPLKITSISVEKGTLCWVWIEEAYEITKEEDFDMLDESIRGQVPDGLFKQITLTFNPWNERHWIKHRFFDDFVGYDSENKPIYRPRENPMSDDGEILALTTNYKCNEWLDAADLKVFENMRIRNPRRYKVAGLGDWGIVEGLVYENWKEQAFTLDDVRNCTTVCGLDFGYTNDPSALFVGFLDLTNRRLYVWDELYEKGLSNRRIYQKICSMGYGKETITADSQEPKSIDELREFGLPHIYGARKGKDSILNGIQFLQDFEIIIHPRCVNFLTEISNYTWTRDRFGNWINVPIDYFNHLMDAMRYACERYMVKSDSHVQTFVGGF